MTYQLWHWQCEWYISRGWWFVDSDEGFHNIHKYILVFALLNFDLVLSFLKINAAWLLFIMLICAKIVEIQYIILFRTSKQRLWESDARNGLSPRCARIIGFNTYLLTLLVDCVNDNQALIMQQTIKLFQIHKAFNKILLKQIRYFLKQMRYPIVLSVWTKSM